MKRAYKKREESIHQSVCKYLKLQYPDCIFSSESGGIRLTMGQAIKAKSLRSESKLPDLLIMEARGGYCGLFIEIKKDSVWLRDGSLSKDKHIQAQAAVLDRLNKKGYCAVFGCGFDLTKAIIDDYMKRQPTIQTSAPEASLIDEWYKNNG